jgi:hypothetical protein
MSIPVESDTPLNPNVPGAGNQNGEAVTSLGAVLGFITEFNANVQIFGLTTFMILDAIDRMNAIQQIAIRHEAQLNALHALVNALQGEVRRVAGQSNNNNAVATSNQRNLGGRTATRD